VKHEDEDNPTPEQREQILQRMQDVSNGFYAAAVRTGNHAFIEFCGFMNEYISICRDAHLAGVDFTMANVHSGRPLFDMQGYRAAYIGEKFGCIFQSSFAGKAETIEAFCRAAFGKRVKVEGDE
jgi:hypothetical protein